MPHAVEAWGPNPWTARETPIRVFFVILLCVFISKRFYWEGCPGGEQEGEGTQEDHSAMWLAVLGFMVMGLVSGCL